MQPLAITWLGHSSFRLRTPGGKEVLLDPWYTGNPAFPAAARPKTADLILISHGHSDHMTDAAAIAKETGASVVGIWEITSWLGGKGVKNLEPMNKGGTISVKGLTITMTDARHSSSIDDGGIVYLGEPAGFVMSDIQRESLHPERTVIGHPFNPPHLIPLVEVCGGKKTQQWAVDWACDFYNRNGHYALKMAVEAPGHVANRLQQAMWHEALHMVANGEATPEDIDIALMNGPAPRLAIQGQCMAFHVACGEGGMATNLDQFGPALKLPWTRLAAPELTKELRDRMVDGCNEMAKGRHFEEMAAERDRAIAGILKAVRAARVDRL